MSNEPPVLPSTPEKKPKSKVPLGCLIAGVIGVVLLFVVAIGAAVLFPAMRAATISTGKVLTENVCHNLKNAVSASFTEYRKYPVEGEAKDATIETNGDFMKEMLGVTSSGWNPRGIPFYSGREARPGGYSGFRKGLNPDPANPALYDPWGTVYRIRVDTNYDNTVEDPARSGSVISESILVWSAGPDGDL